MRRSKKKELNIFTMSALDLFASAMGAFVLIAVISLPYYLNIDQTDIVKSQKEEIEGLKQNASSLHTKIANAIEEKIKCEKEKTKLVDTMAGMGKQNDTLQSQVQGQASQIASLKSRLENSIKFSLLGISTKATSFTVVVDMSGSVKEYKTTIKDTIKRLIKPMLGKSRIQIIGYKGTNSNPKIISWHTPHSLELFTDSMISSADSFIDRIIYNLGEDTPTTAALTEALNYDSEAIILITDGKPNDNANLVIREITRLNNHRKEIHTIAIGNYLKKTELSNFLMKLSASNGGSFMGVASLD